MFKKYLKHSNEHAHIVIHYDIIAPCIDHLPIINIYNVYIYIHTCEMQNYDICLVYGVLVSMEKL